MTRIEMMGAGFIGQMHANAFHSARVARGTPVTPELTLLIETRENQTLAQEVQKRFGFSDLHLDGWEDAVAKNNNDLFINAAPNNMHNAPTVRAANAGMHVFSEKPLAGTAKEAYEIWQAVKKTGVKHQCAFVQRCLPAMRLAREMVQAGDLGEILHFRANFLLDMRAPEGQELSWRFLKSQAGAGAVGDLASHHIDLCRYITKMELVSVNALTKTWTRNSEGSATNVNEDSYSIIGKLENDNLATFEGSRFTAGHSLTGRLEIDGSKGSLSFSMERMNELNITEPRKGPRTIHVLTKDHPRGDFFFPVGIQGAHPHGWRDVFAFQAHHMLSAIEHNQDIQPHAATFEDGYRVAEVVDAVLRSSSQNGASETITFKN